MKAYAAQGLTVSCPRCSAEPEQKCKTRLGNEATFCHMARRIREAKKDGTYMYAPKAAARTREDRIVVVLWAIELARKIGTTQDLIDRRLAEMLVDGDLDLKLF